MNKSCPKPYQKNNYNTSFYPPVNTTFNLYNLGNLLLMRALMRNLIILTLLLHLNQNQIHHHPLPPPPLRKSSRTTHPPSWLKDYINPISNLTYTSVNPNFTCFLSSLFDSHDPIHFQEAICHPHWVKEMNEELQALEENLTWVVTDLPPNKKPIGCK